MFAINIATTAHRFHRVEHELTRIYFRHDQGGCHQRESTAPGAINLLFCCSSKPRRELRVFAFPAPESFPIRETHTDVSRAFQLKDRSGSRSV